MTEMIKTIGGVKVRYDWYQTETCVVLTILKKNVDFNDLCVECKNKVVTVLSSQLSEPLIFKLAHDVQESAVQTKISHTKAEIRLQKLLGIQWSKLEQDDPAPGMPASGENKDKVTAVKATKNWDDVVKLEKLDDDEDPLNVLFKKIYNEGSDEVKKAMNKSFMESNGTVLSTNWNEVGAREVEARPPEGQEYKKWN